MESKFQILLKKNTSAVFGVKCREKQILNLNISNMNKLDLNYEVFNS